MTTASAVRSVLGREICISGGEEATGGGAVESATGEEPSRTEVAKNGERERKRREKRT